MFANCKHKPRSHTLGPIQTISTIVEKFHVSLGYVCRCVSAPKMLESLWAIRFLKVSDAEAPEDVKATLDVFHLVENGVEAVLESVRLQELGTSARAEKQTRRAKARVFLEHCRE